MAPPPKPPSKTYDPAWVAGSLSVACGLLVALPFWVGRFVPLLDLPQHLAMTAILRHAGEPGWGFERFFEPQWSELTPYWFHYLVLYGLSFAMPLETAGRVYVTLYALTLPLAACTFCAALGRPRVAGLLAAPLVLGANLYYGFLGYCAGAVLLLFALAAFERQQVTPNRKTGVALALLTVALFFAHVQMLAFFVGCALLLVVSGGPSSGLRDRVHALAPLAPAVLGLGLPWAFGQFVSRGSKPYFGRVGGSFGLRFEPFWKNLTGLPDAIAGSFQDGSDTWLLGLWVASFAFLAAKGRSEPAASRARARSADDTRRRCLPLVAGALAGYFLAPMSIQGQWNINPRFAFLAVLLAVPLIRARTPSGDRRVAAVALALSLVTGLNAVRLHRAFDHEVGPFEDALATIPREQRVLGLIYDNRGDVLYRWPYLHFPQYAVVRRGGMVSGSFARNAPLPVRFRPGATPLEPDGWRSLDFDWLTHASSFDYVLVRGGPRSDRAIFGIGEPFVEKVFEDGSWRVYRLHDEPPPAHP